jgi:hypothetical protein
VLGMNSPSPATWILQTHPQLVPHFASPLPPPGAAQVGTGIVGLVEQGDGVHAPRICSMPQNGNTLCQNRDTTVVFL